MQLTILENAAELIERADAWDDLWQRSDVALPSARAALLALWLRHFAPQATFRAMVVEENGRLLAALPIVGTRIRHLIEVGTLPSNDWSGSGELLLDRDANAAEVLPLLLSGLKQLPWSLLTLRLMRRHATGWETLAAACQSAGLEIFAHDQHEVGVIEPQRDFAAYEASWSGNHRRHMGKARRKLERDGGAQLQVYGSLKPDEVEPLLTAGFHVEDRGWKAEEGTSVLRTPGMFDFFLRQAQQLAAWRQLQLVFLTHRGRPIAFEYGWQAKETYFTPKVAFDPEFSQYTPSQLLRYRLFERFASEPTPPRVDFLGPLSDATAKWITDRYTVGTTVIALRPVVGRAMLHGYRLLRAAKQRVQGRAVAAPVTPPPVPVANVLST
ncbi:MAG: GNAT family N-acetyltransferase [Planctomycetia bacterium]|nr:GNAT family N-acetyltransferase [Planctomycetia bacterium]